MSNLPITAKSRKLNVIWSIVSAQDLIADYLTSVGKLVLEWFTATPVLSESRSSWLESLGRGDANPAMLLFSLTMGDWEASGVILANPNLSGEIWKQYAWINPGQALRNPSIPMWLLENPQFWERLDPIVWDALLLDAGWEEETLNSFIAHALSKRQATWSLEKILDCPAISVAQGRAVEAVLRECEEELIALRAEEAERSKLLATTQHQDDYRNRMLEAKACGVELEAPIDWDAEMVPEL